MLCFILPCEEGALYSPYAVHMNRTLHTDVRFGRISLHLFTMIGMAAGSLTNSTQWGNSTLANKTNLVLQRTPHVSGSNPCGHLLGFSLFALGIFVFGIAAWKGPPLVAHIVYYCRKQLLLRVSPYGHQCAAIANEIKKHRERLRAEHVLFLRPSSSLYPFRCLDPNSERVWSLNLNDYSGVTLSHGIVDHVRAIAVHSRKTGDRMPLALDDTTSSPTKVVIDCLAAVKKFPFEERPKVFLLLDGVTMDEEEDAIRLVRDRWEALRQDLSEVEVMCYDNGELSESQQRVLFGKGACFSTEQGYNSQQKSCFHRTSSSALPAA